MRKSLSVVYVAIAVRSNVLIKKIYFSLPHSPFCSKFHEGMMMTMTMILYYGGGGDVMGARQCEFKYYVTFLFSTYLCTLKNIINIKHTEKDAQSGRK